MGGLCGRASFAVIVSVSCGVTKPSVRCHRMPGPASPSGSPPAFGPANSVDPVFAFASPHATSSR